MIEGPSGERPEATPGIPASSERDQSWGAGPPESPTPVRRFAATAMGTVLSASMLGLRDALEGPREDRPAVVEDWSGDPFDDDILMRLDPDNPADSIVWIRATREN